MHRMMKLESKMSKSVLIAYKVAELPCITNPDVQEYQICSLIGLCRYATRRTLCSTE